MKLFLSFVFTLVFFFAVLHVNNADENEVDFKQNNLFTMIEISGGFKGRILLTDSPGSGHERCMSFAITQLVPNQNFITSGEALPETPNTFDEKPIYRERKLREHSVSVMHVPRNYIASAATILKERDLQVLKNTDVLAVYATGNFDTYPHTDIYHPGDPYWGHLEEGDFLRERSSAVTFEEVEAHFQAGHAVIATYAIKKPDTFEEFVNSIFSQEYIEDVGGTEALKKMYQSTDKYIRHPYIVRFGGLKEYGFTILLTGNHTTCSKGGRWISPSSSFASAHLSVFAFYLFQLWDTTPEVVEVMQKTAIDIGEPGPDEEFG